MFTISRGRVHDYLVMELDFGTCLGILITSMIKYQQKIMDKFPEVLTVTKACPAGDNSFNIRDNEDTELLPEEMTRRFHKNKAQILFPCKRSIQDIDTLVSFLRTRVK